MSQVAFPWRESFRFSGHFIMVAPLGPAHALMATADSHGAYNHQKVEQATPATED